LTKYFWTHPGPEADATSNTKEYQKYFLWGKGVEDGRYLRLTTLPPSGNDLSINSGRLNLLKP
jgi:hypothetical protein